MTAGADHRSETGTACLDDGRGGPSHTGPRVAHVFGAMDVGGAELRTLEIMERLPDVDALYITLSGRAGVLEERVRTGGGRVLPLALGPTFPWAFVRALRTLEVDVVHSHVATFTGFLLLLARVAGVPRRVAHFRSDGDGHGTSFRRRGQRRLGATLIGRFATAIVGVTPTALAQGYRQDWVDDPRCRVVPNGFDPQRVSATSGSGRAVVWGASAQDTVLIHVGRPSPEKNRVRLVGLLRSTCDLGVSARLVLVGPRDVEDDARLVSAARCAGVAERLVFHGPSPSHEVPALLAQADVLVLPSCREGLPGAAVEARAVGLPVVATDLPGLRYLQVHLDGFWLRSLLDDDKAWARDVVAASNGPRRPLQEALALVAGSPFSIVSAVQAHRELYGAVPAPG